MSITYGSVCSGIEAATVAWHPLGWNAEWFAEIEPFPSAVLAYRWPEVSNLGDMTKLPKKILQRVIPAPAVAVGGTPCQDFSVAGMRAGLAGERGALTISYVETIDAIDYVRISDGEPECVAVWENVPGVLSDKGNAFGCFLGALVGESDALQPAGGKWTDAGCVYGPKRTAAWRVLDAQYFGLAQRRRRVFVVASARAGFDPAAVLFESESVRRDTAPRRGEGQDLSGHAPFRPALQCGCGCTFGDGLGVWGCPNCEGEEGPAVEVMAGVPAFGGHNLHGSVEQSATLTAKDTRLDMESETFFVAPTLAGGGRKQGGYSTDDIPLTTATLDASYGRLQGCSGQDLNHGHSHLIAVHGTQDPCCLIDQAHTLGRNNGQENAVLAFAENSRSEIRLEGGDGQIVGTLSTGGGKPGQGQPVVASIAGTLGANHGNVKAEHAWTGQLAMAGQAVRRLTPRECERLQGFEDDYTLIPTWDGWRKMDAGETPEQCLADGLEIRQAKKSKRWYVKDADGPRYKAIGNSKAVPVVRWIGIRIQRELERAAHLSGGVIPLARRACLSNQRAE